MNKTSFLLLTLIVVSAIGVVVTQLQSSSRTVLATNTCTSPFASLNPTQIVCIQNVLGTQLYNQIDSCATTLTQTEDTLIAQQCFSATPPPPSITPYPSTPMPTLSPTTNNYTATGPTILLTMYPTPPPSNTYTASYSPTPYYPSATNPSPQTTQNPQLSITQTPIITERFPVGDPHRTCIQSVLGSDFDWFNNTANFQSTNDNEKLASIYPKIQICFQTNTTTITQQQTQMSQYTMSDDMKICLLQAVGDARLTQIISGASSPTAAEQQLANGCFTTFHQEQPKVVVTSNQNLPTIETTCLEKVVGTGRFVQISSGTSNPTSAEIQKAASCFGFIQTFTNPQPATTVDTKTEQCMQTAVSKDAYDKIIANQQTPSSDQDKKVSQCFNNINKVQQAFLPPPTQQVLFIPVNAQALTIEKTGVTLQKSTLGKANSLITYKGKAFPNSLIYLYIFSDPIVVSVSTDANGVYQYTMDVPLQPGNHVAYVAARSVSGDLVRSEVYHFAVAQAVASTDKGVSITSTNYTPEVTNYIYWVISILAIGIGFAIAVTYRSVIARKSTELSDESTEKQQ